MKPLRFRTQVKVSRYSLTTHRSSDGSISAPVSASELVPDVVQKLKDLSIFKSENIKINIDGTSRRYYAISAKMFKNSVIPAIPAGQEEDNDV